MCMVRFFTMVKGSLQVKDAGCESDVRGRSALKAKCPTILCFSITSCPSKADMIFVNFSAPLFTRVVYKFINE